MFSEEEILAELAKEHYLNYMLPNTPKSKILSLTYEVTDDKLYLEVNNIQYESQIIGIIRPTGGLDRWVWPWHLFSGPGPFTDTYSATAIFRNCPEWATSKAFIESNFLYKERFHHLVIVIIAYLANYDFVTPVKQKLLDGTYANFYVMSKLNKK